MHQRRVELHHRLAFRRRGEAHVAETFFVRIPGHALRCGAAAGPRQRVGECLAAGHVENVQRGEFVTALGGAIGEVTAIWRGPVTGDRRAAMVGIGVHQGLCLATRPGLRDQHRLRLRRGLLQIEQGPAGEGGIGARGGRDRQLLHPCRQRLALGHRCQLGLGVVVLCLDPALYRRIVGVFQPAVGVADRHAVNHAGGVVRRRGRRQRTTLADQRHIVRGMAVLRRELPGARGSGSQHGGGNEQGETHGRLRDR